MFRTQPSLYWVLKTRRNTYMIGNKFLALPKRIEIAPGKTGWRWLINITRIYQIVDIRMRVEQNPLIFEGTKLASIKAWESIRLSEGYPNDSIEPLSLGEGDGEEWDEEQLLH